jgi:hypothetical protein
MRTRNYQDNLLARISSGLCANAADLQRLDLVRLGRGAEAACQLQDMLADLKGRIARRAALRTSFALDTVEVTSLAA